MPLPKHAPLPGLLLALAACGTGPDGPVRSEPLAERGPRAERLFRELDPAESGLDFTNTILRRNLLPYVYNGAGCASGDLDGDGLPEVYLVGIDGPNRLFRQVAPLSFEDVTEAAGVDGGDAWGTGVTFVDLDDDGDLDVYVCNTESPNLLYRNDGGLVFHEVAAEHGLDVVGPSTMPAFCDYDRDGDLDLYLVQNRMLGATLPDELRREMKLPDTVPFRKKKIVERERYFVQVAGVRHHGGRADLLLQNDGRGGFADVTASAGIADTGNGLSAVWFDYDEDGFPDLFVANDLESPDTLYRNRGDGTFENVTENAFPHSAYFGMGSDAADVNNDGRIDLVVADMSATTHFKAKVQMGDMSDRLHVLTSARPPQYMRNALYLNSGTGRFLEAAHMLHVASTDWTWAIKLGDLDNDGRVDLFATNGIPRFDMDPDLEPRLRKMQEEGRYEEALTLVRNVPSVHEHNLVFQNLGVAGFEKRHAEWGLDYQGVSYGATYSDLDRDGDLDLVVNNMNAPASLYENTGVDGHRVLMRLVGTESNRFGVDARVRLRSASGEQVRHLTLARGYLSSDEPLLHFGLGADTRIEELVIEWPSGARQTLRDLAVDHMHTITERADAAPARDHDAPAPLFEEAARDLGLAFQHLERDFDDYARQPLLPQQHSRLGPGLAWGDANGDGREDLWVGGAAGQAGRLFVADPGGGFSGRDGPWNDHARAEDLGAVWIDFDLDGDEDLYVVSGGVECAPGGELLADRLYVNDGSGSFALAPEGVLPPDRESAGTVSAADVDRDGDLDLFVGGRIVPGDYPTPPRSRLYLNEGGRFSDASERAPALAEVGMVTGSTWSDADGDGWLDLLLVRDWGSPMLLRSASKGTAFVDVTDAAGLGAASGWWNGIVALDADADGDMDYLCTNLGANSKYHASPEEPVALYVNDYDGNGRADLIEAKCSDGEVLPVRGLSCSSNAMPFLAEKFESYESFASANLSEIYTDDALGEALVLRATRLESVLARNRGDGTFDLEVLPAAAQIAPGYGAAATDFDGDGRIDVFLAQNSFSPEPETGRMAGGIGLLLAGSEDGLVPVDAVTSGLVVPDDAKSTTVCDLDGDARPDLVVASSNGPLRAFVNRGPAEGSFAVVLRGGAGNPRAVGARIEVHLSDGTRRTHEIHAGGGYLSQASARTFVGCGAARPERVEILWPTGERTTESGPFEGAELVVVSH
jgi:hypothetical protein